MDKKKFFHVLWLPIFLSVFLSCSKEYQEINHNIIPKPVSVKGGDEFFTPRQGIGIAFPKELESDTLIVNEVFRLLKNKLGITPVVDPSYPEKSIAIRFHLSGGKDIVRNESYKIVINNKGINVFSSSINGLFYGLQTLKQLPEQGRFRHCIVKDYPRFSYRGVHLDVSRHFFSVEEIYRLLDKMSFYKLNRFHWHLTDAGGWRIHLETYPWLTKKSAFRTESDWDKWRSQKLKFSSAETPGSYGGYYTKEDIKKVIDYASKRSIEIIPEIEMPGHSEEVFAVYPSLKCSEKEATGDFCIGNPMTFDFLKSVLTEVMAIFPSKYIHIGGDEANKRAWEKCPKCNALMQKENLKNVDELQSYFIKEIEKFLHQHGRKLIGWDEILQGNPDSEATVMAWRGDKEGIKAIDAGHDVIMTPVDYCYFDFYQSNPKYEPKAIGGYTPVKKVYSYNPIPDKITDGHHHILGAQANVWTEYIPNMDHLEYMIFPRLLALSEVVWSPQAIRDWDDFKPRLNHHVLLLQQEGINTFPLSEDIEITQIVNENKKNIKIKLDSEKHPATIRYTLNGTIPTVRSKIYTKAINVKDSINLVAGVFIGDSVPKSFTHKRVDYHLAIGKPVKYYSKLYDGYLAGGEKALVDGYVGGLTYLDGRWQGYTNSLDCVIDLEKEMNLSSVSARFMQLKGPSVFLPGEVEVLTSSDGENFKSVGIVKAAYPPSKEDLLFQTFKFSGTWNARYIRLKAKEVNNGSFIFVDEIVVW